jgi:hypothetical protein
MLYVNPDEEITLGQIGFRLSSKNRRRGVLMVLAALPCGCSNDALALASSLNEMPISPGGNDEAKTYSPVSHVAVPKGRLPLQFGKPLVTPKGKVIYR